MNARRAIRSLVRIGLGLACLALAMIVGSTAWVAYVAHGRVHSAADSPEAPVAIVLGAKVRDGEPMRFLTGRLEAAVQLIETGRVRTLLVSGDANGSSGNEITAMTQYLVDHGIDRSVIVGDDHGVNTNASCRRAATTFGVTRALVVSQGMHASRAVALCRDAGIDAYGVAAECDCEAVATVRQFARELLARPKVVLDTALESR